MPIEKLGNIFSKNEIVKKENITDNRRKRSPYNENEHSNYEGGSRETSPKLINGQH